MTSSDELVIRAFLVSTTIKQQADFLLWTLERGDDISSLSIARDLCRKIDYLCETSEDALDELHFTRLNEHFPIDGETNGSTD